MQYQGCIRLFDLKTAIKHNRKEMKAQKSVAVPFKAQGSLARTHVIDMWVILLFNCGTTVFFFARDRRENPLFSLAL